MSAKMAFMLRNGAKVITPKLPDILHLRPASFPLYRFEWHTKSKTLYLIRTLSMPQVGDPIAFNVEDHGTAHNMVLIWLRGYREGCTPTLGNKNNDVAERRFLSDSVQAIDRDIAALTQKRTEAKGDGQ